MKEEFETIKLSEKIKGICLKCGKSRSVTIVSEQTVNPFNKNKDGTIKTKQEVFESVKRNLPRLIKRYSDKFICKSCDKTRPWGTDWFNETEYDFLRKFEFQRIISNLKR